MKNKIKIAVVGIGLMGNQHLKAIHLSKKAKLHSIVDINESSRLHDCGEESAWRRGSRGVGR